MQVFRDILNNHNLSKDEKQFKLETIWITGLEKLYTNPEFLKKNFTQKMKYKIKEAYKTIETFEKNERIKKKRNQALFSF